ncbi:MAG TPA: hypothetical protein VNR00_00485 [Opitutus sp.]|nr:hypothetical protein [Opitutus sp.]
MQIMSILRALAPLAAQAGRLVVDLRASSTNAKLDERFGKLEQETLRAGEVLAGVAQQLQALAEQLRVQAEQAEALRRRANAMMIVAGVSLAAAVTALVLAAN